MLCLLTSIGFTACNDVDVNYNADWGDWTPISDLDFESSDSFSEEIDVENHTRMRLHGINGEISITGVSGADSVVISGTKRVESNSIQDANRHLENITVDVQSSANEVLVETIQPPSTWGRQYSVDYTITLPTYMEVQLDTVNGDITIQSMDNDIAVDHTNGNVSLTEIAGSTEVDLVNGTIDSEVVLPLGGTIDLYTVNGNINLDIPEDTSADFEAEVNIGSITLSALVVQDEVIRSTSLTGILGSGQGTISLEADSTGSISVVGF